MYTFKALIPSTGEVLKMIGAYPSIDRVFRKAKAALDGEYGVVMIYFLSKEYSQCVMRATLNERPMQQMYKVNLTDDFDTIAANINHIKENR